MRARLKQQRGFTLTEMAIVVVLGGILLAAGLMAGRGQISRAQAQDVIQIVGDLQTAATSFKLRYGCFPGDLTSATTLLPAPGNTNGTGGTLCNGLIEGTISAAGAATAADETGMAPLQLFAAGLIGKVGPTATARIQTQFGPVHMAANVVAMTSATYIAAFPSNVVPNVIVMYNLPCEVVLDVDRALDDGVDTTGKLRTDPACTAGAAAARTFFPL